MRLCLSYLAADTAFVERLIPHLTAAGVRLTNLFWSAAAADSRYVREEWEHALRRVTEDVKPEHFVRPVYWQRPLADVPDPLRHLHFHFDDQLAA